MEALPFNFSVSEIVAGLIFSAIGIYYFRMGKRDSSISVTCIGVALMGYPYFVSGDKIVWVVGLLLWVAAYYVRNYL